MPQYQGVWTLEQQAQAQSNQQWVTDPNFKNTTLLLQADGTGSGSQNQTFLDGSTNNFFITRNGNTTQGSFSPFSQAPGYWGNYFDGTDDDLSIASDVKLTPAAGDFTLECWIYPTSWASLGSYRSVIGGPVSGCMYFGQTSTGFGLRALAVADVVVTTTLPPTNAWTHVAVSRSGTSARLFINGALVSTATDSTNFAQTQVVIANTSVAGTEEYSGYISNLRFIKGTAIYTSSFTPSTAPLTAVTNTQLLTCQTNRFVDNSTNAFSLSVGGTPSVQAFSPFAPALQWTPDVVGGSGYFDGTTDYLTAPDNAAWDVGSGNWTVETWIYPTASPVQPLIIGQWSGSYSWVMQLSNDSTRNLRFLLNDGTIRDIVGTIPLVLNAWNHCVSTRDGTTIRLYVNGVQAATYTIGTNSISTSTDALSIGASSSGSQPFQGYLSSARFVNGTCLYPSGTTFAPPTAPVTAVANTQLLLNYTNAGIYDGKMGNNLETVGNAQVATSPVKYGSGSMYFDGTGDYLKFPNSSLLQFGTGDFTFEAWIYPTNLQSAKAGEQSIIDTNAFLISVWNNNVHLAQPGVADLADFASSGIVSNTWAHLAITRTGTALRCFVNGIQAGSTTTITNNFTSSGSIFIGAFAAPSNYYIGYMDDIRITKGVARYIANFTPPQQALPRQ